MNTFAERLKAALNSAGMSQEQLAKIVGVSQPAIAKLISGKAKSSRKAFDLALALKINPIWLIHGQGSMHSSVDDSNIPPENEWIKVSTWDSKDPLDNDEVEVPFLKDIEFACGNGCFNETDYNGFKLRFAKSTLRRVNANSDGSGIICFPIKGNSMEPLIPDGATVSVNCNDKIIIDGKVYAINQDGWKRVKQLIRSSQNEVIIRSYNRNEYPDEVAPIDSIDIIGKVFWVASLI
ncbi:MULTISPECIES: XRE family transcriptional regulator [Arsenophonus]|uniref:Helix-turn-helix transcriptional regulator n=1 Tax=Arsenophonus nasoniae TaxID=638 RepID=A0AA95K652_9GAMM|nr:helix-turn-helix transcriptional regulator [Arsenophonus nasoniae]WGM00654.1 helix-turn-helix transcriptional regulator [Arsenophonus nasoniae]WGM01940.1 helix-turn-helix transcriptional regulator [Arsenophonus nasoniae]